MTKTQTTSSCGTCNREAEYVGNGEWHIKERDAQGRITVANDQLRHNGELECADCWAERTGNAR